ncbi:MAG: insulinase family protein [Flavobacteriaceae bacterium]|nr:insulinase family protein [Flavobacteriaceae bacterium]
MTSDSIIFDKRWVAIPIFCFFISFLFSQNTKNYLPKELYHQKLSNGFSYFLDKNESLRNSISLVLKVGSIDEEDDELATAHFLEHIAFRGSENLPNDSFTDYMKDNGLRLGTNFNAETSYDHTIYTINIPSDNNKEITEKTFIFLSDIINKLSIDDDKIESEKKIITQELNRSSKPDPAFVQSIKSSKYANRRAIGTHKNIESINYKKLNGFYKREYSPNKAAIVIVGDIDVENIKRLVYKYFGTINNNKDKTSRYLMSSAKPKIIDIETDITAKKSNMLLRWNIKNNINDIENNIVAKLYKNILRDRLKHSYKNNDITVSNNYFVSDIKPLDIYIDSEQYNDYNTLKNVMTEVLRLSENKISTEELNYYIQQAYNDTYKSYSKTSQYLSSEYISYFLEKNNITSSEEYKKDENKYLDNIKPSHIQSYSSAIWSNDSFQLLIRNSQYDKFYIDESKFVKLKDSLSEQITSKYIFVKQAEAIVEIPSENFELEVYPSEAVRPLSTNKYNKTGITEILYSNGLKVLLRPMNQEGKAIRLVGFANKGLSGVSDKQYKSLEGSTAYMELAGLSNLNASELESYLSSKSFGVTNVINEQYSWIYASSDSDETQEFLVYLRSKMMGTRKNYKEFKEVINDEISSANNHKSMINNAKYELKLSELRAEYIPSRHKSRTIDELQDINLDSLKEFYDSIFKDISAWTFVITGDFDTAKITNMLDLYFGSISKNNIYTRKNKYLFDKDKIDNKTIVKSEVDKNTVSTDLFFYIENQKRLISDIKLKLSEEIIKSELTYHLREKHGLVYSVFVNTTPSYQQNTRNIVNISYETSAKDRLKAKEILIDRIKYLQNSNLTTDTLAKYKKILLLDHIDMFRDNNIYSFSDKLAKTVALYSNIADLERYKNIIEKIKPSELKCFFRNHFDVSTFKEVVLEM